MLNGLELLLLRVLGVSSFSFAHREVATINGPVVKVMRAICQQLINSIASPLKNVAM
ncbi:hypothetical protein HanXRQr2_Chr17g0804721 [Helianthus annuus]|uniref:Uncharacterized protein n=1 Tax=Helianthus annuus TaxID=4232 RepID=A0A9K3GUT0_HELAN|nr:hypothetical protein HanXRQr2_Chr17g0804721 [Helianthus annuus]